MSDDLTDLVERSLAGDAQGVHLLVERLHRPVLSLCLRMMEHRQDAEDTAQETLVRMIRYLGSWDRGRPFVPWVMTIAANRCRTARQRRRALAGVGTVPDEVSVPPEGVGQREISALVESALKELREDYRAAFVLFHLEQMSIEDVSQSLSVPTGTVKTWLHRARKQLAEILRTHGIQPGDAS